MKRLRWMLALMITTIIVSCNKDNSINEQPGKNSDNQSEFATQISSSCIAPGELSVTYLASTTATLNWGSVSGALVYTVQYKATSSNTWIVATSGTYGLSVNLYELSPSTVYDWRVYTNCSLTEASGYSYGQFTTLGSTPPSSSPCPGPLDVSSNGSMSGAAFMNVNTDVKGTISPANDVDYYKFTINSYGTIAVWLTTLPANYDLAVYNSSGGQIAVSKNKGTKDESISLIVNTGTYYAKVYPSGKVKGSSSCYTLRVQPITATGQ